MKMPRNYKSKHVLLDSKKKTAIIRQYRKFLKKDSNMNSLQKSLLDDSAEDQPSGSSQGSHQVKENSKKMSIYKRALFEYKKKQSFQEIRKQEKEKARKEKEEALRKYKLKKQERFKKLSKKTKWGQPAMNPRIELLLEKIQKSM